MALSTKPEVHNILHYCQRRTEARPQVTCTEKLVKFVELQFLRYANGQTDRQSLTGGVSGSVPSAAV